MKQTRANKEAQKQEHVRRQDAAYAEMTNPEIARCPECGLRCVGQTAALECCATSVCDEDYRDDG